MNHALVYSRLPSLQSRSMTTHQLSRSTSHWNTNRSFFVCYHNMIYPLLLIHSPSSELYDLMISLLYACIIFVWRLTLSPYFLYSFSFQKCIHEETRIWLLGRLDDRKTSNANVNMLGFKIKFESLSSTYCVLPIRTKVSEEILLWYMTCMPYRSESELWYSATKKSQEIIEVSVHFCHPRK